MDDGWICDAVDAPNESWMSDAPWFKANQRHGHDYLVRHRSGVSNCHVTMSFVKRENFLRQIFYGDTWKRQEEMMGLSSYYGTTDRAAAQSAANVIDASGTDNLTSAWVIAWGPRSVYMVTPEGLPPVNGLSEAAIVVADWRFVARIANIDVRSDVDLDALLDRALLRLPVVAGDNRIVRSVIYMNSQLKKEAVERRGIFIRPMDDIRCDEERVI